jgi:putative resolvase
MNLKQWAPLHDIHPRLPTGSSGEEKNSPVPTVRVGLHTSVSTHQTTSTGPGDGLRAPAVVHHQRGDLERRITRPGQRAATAGLAVVGIQAEVAAGLPGQRRLLADPKVTAMVVEHRDQLARMNVDLIQAALAADGCPLVAGR